MEKGLITERTDALHGKAPSLSYLLACLFVVILGLFFSLGCFSGRTDDVRTVQLLTRINPNQAPVASLVRLPQIGTARAEQIAAYRQANSTGKPAFTCPDDLQKVKGIGPAIAGQLADYLRFE